MKSLKLNKARLFLERGESKFLLLSIEQSKDGSIYVSWPNFSKSLWPSYQDQGSLKPSHLIASIDDGKLSIHSSGLAGFREHNTSRHRSRFYGNPLITQGSPEKRGVRHLVTFFADEPNSLPQSPCFNRKGDLLFQSSFEHLPFVLILFALPIGITSIKLNPSFHYDCYNLNDLLGQGLFSLRFHQILWFKYKNRRFINWPRRPHCFFHDGFRIPFFTGMSEENVSLVFAEPTYNLEDKALTISWVFPNI